MISVQNRLPEPGKENRISITPDSGEPIEGVLAYADNASQQGTFWNRSTAQLLQGDIRTYPVRDGQSISAGDVVNVSSSFSENKTIISIFNIGDVVGISEDGVIQAYQIVNIGKPSEMYDDSCDGVWVTRVDAITSMQFDSGGSTVYETSDLDSFLENDVFSKYDEETKLGIKSVKIPYLPNGGSTSNVLYGENGLQRKIFLLGKGEVGGSGTDTTLPLDGTKLPIFSSDDSRIKKYNNQPIQWILRTPYMPNDGISKVIATGRVDSYKSNPTDVIYVVPSLVLSYDTKVYAEKTIYRDVTPQANVENVLGSLVVLETMDVCKVNDEYSFVAYRSGNSIFSNVVRNIDGISIDNSLSIAEYAYSISLDKLDNSKFIIQYYAGATYARIGTITGGYASVGNQYTVVANENGNTKYQKVVSLSGNTVLSVYSFNGIKCQVLPISGTTITTSGTVYSLPNNTGANYISACKLPDDTNGNKRVCICFSDAGDGDKGKAVIATIDSSNTVTFGDVVTFASDGINGSNNPIKCCEYEGNVIVIYNASTRMRAMVLTISGNSIATNSSVELLNGNASYPFVTIVGDAVVLGYTVNAKGYSMVASIDGTTIIVEHQFIFANSAVNYISPAGIDEGQFVLAYADTGNSNYGTTTILEISGNQIAGSFIDNSSDAIALADGMGGQSIPVGFGGYCECPGVTEGQEITSDGVSAFSPLDGWLYLLGAGMKKIGTQIVTGSYVGTGKYGSGNPNTLTFDFEPKILFILSNDATGGMMVINGSEYATTYLGTYAGGNRMSSSTGTTFSWYWNSGGNSTTYPYVQMNQSGMTYRYIAIG